MIDQADNKVIPLPQVDTESKLLVLCFSNDFTVQSS